MDAVVPEAAVRPAQGLMSYEEVAKMFPGRTVRWVRDFLVAPKRVDSVKIGRYRFIVRASLVRLIARSTTHAHPSKVLGLR